MRRALTLCLGLVLLAPLAGSAVARVAVAGQGPGRATWKVHLDEITAGKAVGIAVHEEGRFLYRRDAKQRRIPASNQKLLMAMALFDALDTEMTIATSAASKQAIPTPVLEGNLWILGHGDPSITGGGRFGDQLPFEPTRLGDLARSIQAAGVTRIEGRVIGNTGYFAHDWSAPGWKSDFPEKYVPLPTALTFEGNTRGEKHVTRPELRAAVSLTRKLEDLGISVAGRPGASKAPAGLRAVASIESPRLSVLARFMNRRSSNFFAEVLGKRLGVQHSGVPGTIAKGAAATASWAASLGVGLVAHDSSGLSYENKIAPRGMVRLLGHAEDQTWGQVLRTTLPAADEGTLEDRFNGVRLRAKTGTLEDVSTLSGYVWLRRSDTWAEFSILSGGMEKWEASALEEEIVRTLTRHAS
jgi:serine-type D-Ala-D-Ala carboxypeptidase/endopeptidase (penicillin-binding protein 4)